MSHIDNVPAPTTDADQRRVPQASTQGGEPRELRVLILEDQPEDAELIERELHSSGFQLETVRLDTEAGFRSQLGGGFDLILSDYAMPQFDALRALELLQQSGLDIPFIVVTGSFEDRAIECMKRGAADYLLKDRLGRLGPAVQQALEDRKLRQERIRIEQALRESEARFRSVAESAVDALVLVDANGAIGYSNPATEQIFGYSEPELEGQPLARLLAEVEREGVDAKLDRVLQPGSGATPQARTELVGRKKDGTQFPVELALSSWQVAGAAFASASMRDLTESKLALTRAQLQDRLAAVGQLAAGIAHDFNNILGTIMLYSELLLRNAQLPEKQEAQLRTMVQQARRGATLVSQILDFSRRSVVQRQAMDLVPYLSEMVDLLSRTLPESIRVELESRQERGVVEADPTRLQQVVMNLGLNARDAMPDGGVLRIALDRNAFAIDHPPPFDGMPMGPWLRLRLQDTGTGIPPEDLPHVFEPFFTTKPVGEGTGLGLAQVYGLVKQHNGYIDVASEVGAGTTFTIYLPETQRVASDPESVQASQGMPGAGETILLVEDDETTREAVAEILRSLAYQVMSAETGLQAIEIFAANPDAIDLVLSDLVMPDMGGKALYQQLTEKYEGVKMLLMTGYPLGLDTKELLDRRKLDWLQKPFSAESVGQKVRQMLARK